MLRTVGYLRVKFPFSFILFAEVITNKSFSTGKTIGPRPIKYLSIVNEQYHFLHSGIHE